jgi:hypothetical protein
LFGGQQAIGFDDVALAVNPFGLNGAHGMRNEMIASEQRNGREEFLMRER